MRKRDLETRLADVEEHIQQAPNPDLIDALPVTKIRLDQLPEDLVRSLFEALRLEIRYNRTTHRATCRVTLTGQTISAAPHAANDAAGAQHELPPAGHHTDGPAPELWLCGGQLVIEGDFSR